MVAVNIWISPLSASGATVAQFGQSTMTVIMQLACQPEIEAKLFKINNDQVGLCLLCEALGYSCVFQVNTPEADLTFGEAGFRDC